MVLTLGYRERGGGGVSHSEPTLLKRAAVGGAGWVLGRERGREGVADRVAGAAVLSGLKKLFIIGK